MTASLTTTIAVLDLLPRDSIAPARRRMEAPTKPHGAGPQPAESSVPLRHRLLPLALRRRWADRAARRALAGNLVRLRETSPHLLEDIGLLDWDGTVPAMAAAEASELELVPSAARDTSWRLAGPMRPVWNAPDHWLR